MAYLVTFANEETVRVDRVVLAENGVLILHTPVDNVQNYQELLSKLTAENLKELHVMDESATIIQEYVNAELSGCQFTAPKSGSKTFYFGDYYLKAQSAPDISEKIINTISQGLFMDEEPTDIMTKAIEENSTKAEDTITAEKGVVDKGVIGKGGKTVEGEVSE